MRILGSRGGPRLKLLAIDIGASGGKAVVGEFVDNTLRTSVMRKFPNRIIDVQGHKHLDILQLFSDVKECIRSARDVESIGLDTWAVDYGYIGRDGDLLGLPFAYRDSRTENSIPFVHSKISREEIYKITGIQFLPFNTIYQIADDLSSRPGLVENAHKLIMIPELLGYLLTGIPTSEYTNASTTSLLDVNSRKWSVEILNKLGYPGDKLLTPVEPGSVRVPLCDPVSDDVGAKIDFTYVACHDTACAVAGIPAMSGDDENWAYISSGTWSLVGMELKNPIVTDAARDANFTNEGGVNRTIRFLSNVTGLWLQNELQRAWSRESGGGGGVSFEVIRKEVESAPPFRSIIDPDHKSLIAPDDMRVAIRSFCEKTGQTVPKGVGPLMRCVFESLALVYRRKIRTLKKLTGRNIDRIHVVGGGSKDSLLNQMTADACGKPVIAGPSDATATGNLLIQAVSKGIIGNIDYGRRIVANSFDLKIYEPKNTDLWEGPAKKLEEILQLKN